MKTVIIATAFVLLCLSLTTAGVAQQCDAGTTIPTPSHATNVDAVVLRRSLGTAYYDERINDIVQSQSTITLTFHWNSEVPPVPPPPYLTSKCVYWVAEVGQLPVGLYTIKWVVHDDFWNTNTPAGDFQLAVSSAVPLLNGAVRLIMILTLVTIGCVMLAAPK